MALALAKLVSKKRGRFAIKLNWLRYPVNVLALDDREKLRQKIGCRLSTWLS